LISMAHQFLVMLKYKIDWLDEDDVAMVKSAIERYSK
jgi:hypothetical protein